MQFSILAKGAHPFRLLPEQTAQQRLEALGRNKSFCEGSGWVGSTSLHKSNRDNPLDKSPIPLKGDLYGRRKRRARD